MLRRVVPRLFLSTGSTGHLAQPAAVAQAAPIANTHHPPGGDYGTAQQFEQHWTSFFSACPDTFELQRGLNNCFNYDLVPPPAVLEAALLACRRLHSFATGVRLFGALRGKVANEAQYAMYVGHLRPLIDAAGLCTPEELGRPE